MSGACGGLTLTGVLLHLGLHLGRKELFWKSWQLVRSSTSLAVFIREVSCVANSKVYLSEILAY